MPTKTKITAAGLKNPTKSVESADEIRLPSHRHFSKRQKSMVIVGFGLGLIVVSLVFLRLSYHDRIYPGVRIYGVYLGGLTPTEASNALSSTFAQNKTSTFSITTPSSTITTSETALGAQIDSDSTTKMALALGRTGNPAYQIWQQIKYMIGKGNPDVAVIKLDPVQFADLYQKVAQASSVAVQNATFSFQLPNVTIVSEQSGRRVDIASFANALEDGIALNSTSIATPIDSITPQISASQLQPLLNQASIAANTKLTLTFDKKSWPVAQSDLLSWLNVSSTASLVRQNDLEAYYQPLVSPKVSLDTTRVAAYVGRLAGQINTTAVDAQLSVTDGRATIFAPSRDGATLNVADSTQAIVNALASSMPVEKSVPLVVAVQKANIRDDTITQLGITDLLSEGVTYFPGSSKNRLNNIRVGQSQFQGALIKPDEVFSFGKQMGPVGPAQGYLPGLVILNGHEENQYGGGMCQVSSTLYRAALLAGLPIVERHNHAFAVSFYTAPYGVPGIDATIYYPNVDLKIKNDTGHYILIQTQMTGTTLTFRLYGTKTKEGQIRGPSFIDGSNDATKPSTTVFYRDILVNGQVTKTDTITTHYQSSLDFPVSTD